MIQPLDDVRRNFASSAIIAGALLLLIVGGCTKPAQENGASTRQTNAPSTAALAKLYEPSSLTEVREVQQFPADLKAALSDNGLDITKSKTRPAQFLVGGLSATAAIIEYEQFDYVPSYHAAVYVLAGRRWYRLWDWPIAPAFNLPELVAATRSLPP